MLNSIILLGRATKDPELRKGVSGTFIGNFDIAVDNVRKQADGTRGTSFFKVVAFSTLAETCSKFVRKGSKIAIKGTIQQRTWMGEDGVRRSTYEVYAESLELLDPKPELDQLDIPDDDYDGGMDSGGSLEGETYEDENGVTHTLHYNPPKETPKVAPKNYPATPNGVAKTRKV